MIELIGALDEFNASIGMALALLSPITSSGFAIPPFEKGGVSRRDEGVIDHLQSLQSTIFSIGAILAGSDKIKIDFEILTTKLEKQIDEWSEKLPPLQNFILPGGAIAASQLHLSRTICRRVERKLVGYTNVEQKFNELKSIEKYINRLSDWLFVLARIVNLAQQGEETLWQGA